MQRVHGDCRRCGLMLPWSISSKSFKLPGSVICPSACNVSQFVCSTSSFNRLLEDCPFLLILGVQRIIGKTGAKLPGNGVVGSGKDPLENISKKPLYQGHGKPSAFLPMILLTLYFHHKYNTFANDSIVRITQSLSQLTQSLSQLTQFIHCFCQCFFEKYQ